MRATAIGKEVQTLRTLPGDDVRQILWRFAERYDLQMLINPCAPWPAAPWRALSPPAPAIRTPGPKRNSNCCANTTTPASPACSWTSTTAATSPGRRTSPSRWWRSSSPGWTAAPPPAAWRVGLALAPIHERGTNEQRTHYMQRCVTRRRSRAGARVVCPHRADPLRRRRNGAAVGQSQHRRMERRRRARPARHQARALHHRHGLRQLRHRRRGHRRRAHLQFLHGDP